MKSISIVILNWNGRSFLERFLPGVVQNSTHPVHRVELVVADNGSTDGSIEWLGRNFPQVRTIALDRNYGFAQGYNLALEQIQSDYYLILNSDVEVNEGWLPPLVDFMEEHDRVAACMPKILNHSNPKLFEYAGAAGGFIDMLGYPFCRGRILSAIEADHGQYDVHKPVFWATGACLLIKAKDFFEAGGFDGIFFAHMEEIDLCWRLKRMGKEIWCVPTSYVLHVGGGTLPNNTPRKLFLNHRNNLLMLYKNLSPIRMVIVIPARILLDVLSLFAYILSGKFSFITPVFKAHSQFLYLLPTVKSKRKEFSQKHSYKVQGLYPKSILYQFFAMGKRYFSQLGI